jgi:hypothetical protein
MTNNQTIKYLGMEPQQYGYVSLLENELIEMLKGVVLPEMSVTSDRCIYKVPQIIRQANPQAYTPQMISIGPFHNPRGSISTNNNLHEMEELKLKYLKGFLIIEQSYVWMIWFSNFKVGK